MSDCVPQFLRRLFASLAMSSLLLVAADGAFAQQSCQDDFQKLTGRRMAGIQRLNALGKAGKGKMDPVAACPAARNLAGIENEMLSYMTKNKDWCNIPDNVLDQFKQARGKTQNFAAQACSVAVKVKKMQAMQKIQQQRAAQAGANGGLGAPQKLPAGPL